MRPSRVAAGVAVAAGVSVAAFSLFHNIVNGRSGPAAPAAGKSVLVDVRGEVLAEFPGGCEFGRYTYLCRQVEKELLSYDKRLVARGGLTIRTTIDPSTQRAAQRAIDGYVGRDDDQVVTQVMIVPGTGAISAMAGNRGPGPRSGWQQGTTAMVYTLAAALENGMRFGDGFPSSDEYRAPGYSAFQNCAGQNVGDPTHTVRNRKNIESDFTTLVSGTRAAVNSFYVKVEEKIGLCEAVKMAGRLGLERADGGKLREFETFTLGINETDAVTIANTYATLAARGRRCAPMVVAEIGDRSGVIRTSPPRCRQVLDPAVADAVTSVLSRASAAGNQGIDRPAAGMPGTTDVDTAAWYAGYTPGLAAAVGLGYSSGGFGLDLTDVVIGGEYYSEGAAMSIPAAIWRKSMIAAHSGTAASTFVKPDMRRFGGCRSSCPT